MSVCTHVGICHVPYLSISLFISFFIEDEGVGPDKVV